jgi:hypothetical protein
MKIISVISIQMILKKIKINMNLNVIKKMNVLGKNVNKLVEEVIYVVLKVISVIKIINVKINVL